MASNKKFRTGPVNISNVVGNLLNPGTTTGGVGMGTAYGNLRIVLTKVEIINRTGSSHTFQLYVGATGGSASGTEICGFNTVVAANSKYEDFLSLPLDVADFVTGVADATACLTVTFMGEIGVA
jgi:hypothetical protein